MPTPTKGPRLGGSPAHERLILANLAQSLFEFGKITTTTAKAKRLRPVAEKLITAAKRNTLHSRRQVLKTIRDKDVVHKLFAEIGPSFATREGGYTRITKTLPRKGDNAPMAVIELIDEETVSSAASRVARTAASKKGAEAKGAASQGAGQKDEHPPADEVQAEHADEVQPVPAESAEPASQAGADGSTPGTEEAAGTEEVAGTEEASVTEEAAETGSAPDADDAAGAGEAADTDDAADGKAGQ